MGVGQAGLSQSETSVSEEGLAGKLAYAFECETKRPWGGHASPGYGALWHCIPFREEIPHKLRKALDN
jgi:hypothetical protein